MCKTVCFGDEHHILTRRKVFLSLLGVHTGLDTNTSRAEESIIVQVGREIHGKGLSSCDRGAGKLECESDEILIVYL